MIRLGIKGTLEQALLAANQRGIPLKDAEVTRNGTVWANADEEHLVRIVHWYCEDTKTEEGLSPPGTLLMHC